MAYIVYDQLTDEVIGICYSERVAKDCMEQANKECGYDRYCVIEEELK